MKKTPDPRPVQRLSVYTGVDGGGCRDVGTLQLDKDVFLYNRRDIEDALINERIQFIPYLLSVLEVLRR